MFESCQLTEDVDLRALRLSDASALAAAYVRNRDYLAPWNPVHPEVYYTAAWQASDMSRRLVAIEAGDALSFGLFSGETVVGRFNLAGISRGPFQSGILSYWVDSRYTGCGLASAAVQVVVENAREELGLHRIEAATLLHNAGSQRVLQKAGFQQIGTAPRYLQIAGTWQDHILHQIVLHE